MSGIGYPQKPNRRLVSEYPRLPARAVPRWGTVTLEWPQNLANASLTRASPAAVVVSTGGVEVEVELREWPMPSPKGKQRGTRWRFVCCRCEASRDALHWIDGAWGCRGCLDLAYPCRHRQRYCPAIRRRAMLLRKLARVPAQTLKAKVLREKIAQQEAIMLASVQRVNRDVVKRRQRYAGRVDSSQRSG